MQGPKGKLRQALPTGIGFEVSGKKSLQARTLREDPELGKFLGLARSLVANAVRGVTEGFRKDLDIVGVGYRAEVKGKQVHFALAIRIRWCSTSRGASTSRSTADPRHGDGNRIGSWWDRWRRTSTSLRPL